jgi:hypothetical protein
MVGSRPLHIFIYSISLAAAGCANITVLETQTSVGGAPLGPKTVLVNNFDFPPDVAGVDRELAARLESKFGNMSYDVIKSLAAKRVSDEIVATTVVIVDAAGLKARPGSQDEPTRKNGALLVTGRLRAVDQGNSQQRNPVSFGAGSIAADVTLSKVSAGVEKQVLNFTAQAQIGRQSGAAIGGPNAAALSAAISKVLADKSAADVKLPPNVETLARGLGRAVAGKIVTYARDQGWVNNADLPATTEDINSVKKKPGKLPQSAVKRDEAPTSTATIPCEAFVKNARGNWYVRGSVTFDLGSAKNQTLRDIEITPKFFTIGGIDLYEAVQKSCG